MFVELVQKLSSNKKTKFVSNASKKRGEENPELDKDKMKEKDKDKVREKEKERKRERHSERKRQ